MATRPVYLPVSRSSATFARMKSSDGASVLSSFPAEPTVCPVVRMSEWVQDNTVLLPATTVSSGNETECQLERLVPKPIGLFVVQCSGYDSESCGLWPGVHDRTVRIRASRPTEPRSSRIPTELDTGQPPSFPQKAD